MKKNRIILALSCMVAISNICYAENIYKTSISINGVEQSILSDKGEVFVKNGFTYVPLVFIAEKLGHDVKWDAKKQTVTIDGKIVLTINSKTVKTEKGSITMDTVPFVKNNRTYVPIRFVSEALGYKVGYKYVAGVNCVLISGKSGSTNDSNNSTNDSVAGVPTYDWSDFQGTLVSKYYISSSKVGSNSNNTTTRKDGTTWEEERTYLNSLLGKLGWGYAKDGQLTIGSVEDIANEEAGMNSSMVAVFKNGTQRQVSIRAWVTDSNTNPSRDTIVGQNAIIEALKYYSDSASDGLKIYAYLNDCFSNYNDPTYDKEVTFGSTTVKFHDPGKFGIVIIFTAN